MGTIVTKEFFMHNTKISEHVSVDMKPLWTIVNYNKSNIIVVNQQLNQFNNILVNNK